MSMSGKTGSVGGANGATEVSVWSVTEVQEPLEVSNFDSAGWREFVDGLQSATGSFSNFGERPSSGAATALILDAGSTTGDLRLSGAANLSDVETSVDVAGVVEFSTDFNFNGVMLITTVP